MNMAGVEAMDGPLWLDDQFDMASASIKALAHPLRIKILYALAEGEACTTGITQVVGTTPSNISQHLVGLRDQGILISRRRAHRVFYRLADPRLLHMIEIICQMHPVIYS